MMMYMYMMGNVLLCHMATMDVITDVTDDVLISV